MTTLIKPSILLPKGLCLQQINNLTLFKFTDELVQGNGEEGTGNSDSFGGGLYLPQTSFPLKRGGFKPSIKGTEKRCSLFPVPCSLRGNSLGERMQELLDKKKADLLTPDEVIELETIGELDNIFSYINAVIAVNPLREMLSYAYLADPNEPAISPDDWEMNQDFEAHYL